MKNLILVMIILVAIGCKNSNDQVENGKIKNNAINVSEIENYLDHQANNDSLHGVVLIADKEQILLKKAYGYKDLNQSKKHTVDGTIGLASMPKMLTAISIMQLTSQGKIDIDKPIGNYLTDLENTLWKDITVKNLLSHTSGLGFYWDYPPEEISTDLDSLYEIIKKRDTEPNERNVFNYSNNGYIVLGKIIQEVSGLSYKEYITKHIINPLKMYDTQLGLPDGGHFESTADDLLKFSKALRNDKLINGEVLNEMKSKQSDVNYGLGFKLEFRNNSKLYGHTGGFASDDSGLGIASGMDIVDERYTVIVLTNRNPAMGGPKARSFILNYLLKK
ncbi:beta-lactamase family protein [Flavobacteriaceae bacterium]|nr:beta-lactamase family protein [Flavobacteriaceae bacterium]